MQIHPNLKVITTAQNLGSSILLICRGLEEDLELMLNSFLNFGAISPVRNQLKEIVPIEMEFEDGCHNITTFWTTQEKLVTYFENLFWIRTPNSKLDEYKKVKKQLKKEGKENPWWKARCEFVKSQINELLENNSEVFINYAQRRKGESNEFYSSGKISAERPDFSFKEEVVNSAFKPQESVG